MTKEEYEFKEREINERYHKLSKDAIREESEIRELVWIDGELIPVAGFLIRHITWHDYLVLSRSGNSFFNGEIPFPADIIDFLFWMRPGGKTGWRRFWFNVRFRLFSKLGFNKGVEEINNFLNDSLQDTPCIPRKKSEHAQRVYPTSFISSICHRIGSTYGIDPEKVLHKSIARTLQLDHEISIDRASKNGKSYVHVSSSERQLTSAHLRELQELEDEYKGRK